MFSRVQYTADGTNKTFTVPFPYINKSHVQVTINGMQAVLPLLWVTDALAEVQDFLTAGDVVELFRATPSDSRMVQFVAPATLTTEDLNLSSEQNFYVSQEILDRMNALVGQALAKFPGAGASGDVDTMVDNITQSILNSALLADLQSHIGAIDFNAESIIQQTIRVDGHQDLLNLLGIANVSNTAFILNTDTVQVDATTTMAQKFSGMAANIGTNTAAIVTEATARANGDSALAQQISVLVAGTATFYVQPTAPTSPNTGDVWYDSDDNNHPYKWDGSQWVDVRDGQFAVLAAQITTEQTARTDADTATAQTIALLGAVNGAKTAFILDQNKTFVDATTSLASKLAILAAADSSNAAAINTEQTARVGADGALSTRVDNVVASAASNASAILTQAGLINTNTAAIQTEQTARANGDSALSTRVDTVFASAAANTAAIQTEQTARANGDSANATSISTVQTTVNGHTASIAAQASSINGLQGQYTVKVDVNGYVAGFGLANYTNNDGTHTSQFLILADQFAVVKPGKTPVVPFVVDAVSGTVAIDGTLLVKGSIAADKINVGNLSALAANMGTVTGGLFRTAANGYRSEIGNDSTWPIWYGTGTKSAANGLFYVDNAGNTTVQNLTVKGVANAANGLLLTGGLIDMNTLRIDCGGGRRAPIVFEDVSTQLNPSKGALTVQLGTFYGPGYDSGFYGLRCAAQKMDVFFEIDGSGDSGLETLNLQASYDGGAWSTITSITKDLNFRSNVTWKVRYTTLASWNTVIFRVTNTSSNLMNLAVAARCYNTGPSSNTAGSYSNQAGSAGGGGVQPPPAPPGGQIP